VKEFGFDLA